MALIDLTKAFDTVNIWNILHKFGSSHTFVAILHQFHASMCAQVVVAGSLSSIFPVDVGVKEDCVLASIIFNLLIITMTLVSHHDLQPSDSTGVEYRLDNGHFNLRRFYAKTTTSSALISAHWYADDAANPNLTADGLQSSLDVFSETYLIAGLIDNPTKIDVHSASSPDAPTSTLVEIRSKILKILSTWAQMSHLHVT